MIFLEQINKTVKPKIRLFTKEYIQISEQKLYITENQSEIKYDKVTLKLTT